MPRRTDELLSVSTSERSTVQMTCEFDDSITFLITRSFLQYSLPQFTYTFTAENLPTLRLPLVYDMYTQAYTGWVYSWHSWEKGDHATELTGCSGICTPYTCASTDTGGWESISPVKRSLAQRHYPNQIRIHIHSTRSVNQSLVIIIGSSRLIRTEISCQLSV